MATDDTNQYYPSITNLMDMSELPDFLDFLKEGIEDVTNNLFYKDYQSSISLDGSSASYSLDLVLKDKLSMDILGTGMSLVINPDKDNPTATPFPISIFWEWKILKYIRNFSLENFSYKPEDFFHAALNIFGVSEEQIILFMLDQFVVPENNSTLFEQLLADINGYYGSSITIDETDEDCIGELISQVNAYAQANDKESIYVAILVKYLTAATPAETLNNLNSLFSVYTTTDLQTYIKDLLIPKFTATLGEMSLSLEFPRTMLQPIGTDYKADTNQNHKSKLTFDVGSVSYSTENGLQFNPKSTLTLEKSMIGNTGLIVSFTDAKLDLSKTTNIPEATAAGYPDDFVGVYVGEAEIDLPPDWFKNKVNPANTTLGIYGTGLLLGTGGISGKFGLKAIVEGQKEDPNGAKLTFDMGSGFKIGFSKFELELKQGEFVSTDIKGSLTIPGLKDAQGKQAEIDVDVSINKDGDFKITASETGGIPLEIPNVARIIFKTVSVGKENNKFFISTSASLDFSLLGGAYANLFPAPINIDELIIWEDGSIQLKGFDGTFKLPKAVTLNLGPAIISVTALHFGTHEQNYGGRLRKYWYVGFDGGISINPGGIDARGDGIKLYFTVDDGDFNFFFRIQSINVDIIIPGGASKEDAAVIINGYLAVKDPSSSEGADASTGHDVGTEYIGGVDINLKKISLQASASMRLKPSVPAFLVDLNLSLPTCIPLGATGLGIYGFRGLLGQKYVATKHAAGLTEDASWTEYYKAKVSPDYKQGVQVSKFENKDGFTLGAGISLATGFDKGRTFSSKLFFMISLPDYFLFEGQANILSQRIDLDTSSDPPFYATLIISSKEIEASLGVNIQIPSETGKIASVSGLMEMKFVFGDAGAWYLNVGRDTPAEKRVQARILTLFNAYFYFMVSKQGIKAGAGASWAFNKHLGPIRVSAGAFLDVSGKIGFKPVQIGGSIALGGYASIKVWKFGFSISIGAGLSAEAPHPFNISGYITLSIKLPWPFKRLKFTLDFSWSFNQDRDISEIILLDATTVKAVNMMSNETFVVCGFTINSSGDYWPDPNSLPYFDYNNYVIPVDSFLDIEFDKGMFINSSLSRYGVVGVGGGCVELIPPQKGKAQQVVHAYLLDDIAIYSLNASGGWETYNVIEALTPLTDKYNLASDVEFVQGTEAGQLMYGYWQTADANKHNKLRIMATSPLSFLAKVDNVTPEELGYKSDYLTCPAEQVDGKTVIFDKAPIYFPQNAVTVYDGVQFIVTQADGSVEMINHFNETTALTTGGTINIYFPKSYAEVNMDLLCTAKKIRVTTYNRALKDERGFNLMPLFEWQQLDQTEYTDVELTAASSNGDYTLSLFHLKSAIETMHNVIPIDKITIEVVETYPEGGLLEDEDTGLMLQEAFGDLLLEDYDPSQNKLLLFKLNMLTLEEYMINDQNTDPNHIQGVGDALRLGFSKCLQPIWRPDTEYLVQIKTSDILSSGNRYDRIHNFMFKTAGPVGHFHRFITGASTVTYQTDFAKVKGTSAEEQFKLATLKNYIDMNRSYPNADGRLTNAKPLYYKAPELHLFYNQNYVYTMFNNFASYKNRGGVNSSLEVVIKDPLENSIGMTVNDAIATTTQWVKDIEPKVSNDLKLINNTIQNINGVPYMNCSDLQTIHNLSLTQVISPATTNLDPDKLYTAIFKGKFQGAANDNPDSVMLHSYPFKTSIYGNFKEHVNSIGNTADGFNIFTVEHAITDSTVYDTMITQSIAILNNSTTQDAALQSRFADRFDRIVNGALKVGSLPPAATTEVTVLKYMQGTQEQIVGLLLRSPEPFIDPKITDDVIEQLKEGRDQFGSYKDQSGADIVKIRVLGMEYSGASESDTFTVIYSKDRAMAFISNAAMILDHSSYDIIFQNVEYDGNNYVKAESVRDPAATTKDLSPVTVTIQI